MSLILFLLLGISTLVRADGLPTFDWNKMSSPSVVSGISALPVVYQEIPDPSRTLDTSMKVGRIEGTVDVSSTGAATYQIPIKVLDGTNKMQPQITVGYNSQSGNGIMGYGWNVSAISFITRTGKNFYFDGTSEAVQLGLSDNLLLDGKRLIRIIGSYLSIGSVYAPEVEDYSLVDYVTINGRDAFRVRTKDGMVYEYGTNSDSYIKAQNSNYALYWLLSKVSDRHGNYMLYHYDTNLSSGEFRISSIEYTGNTNVAPYNRVDFVYNTRDDAIESYVAGNMVSQRVLLTGIKSSSHGKVLKEYKFKYIYDHYYSKLSEIEEYGLNGSRYNSTIINWGDIDGEYSRYANEYLATLSSTYHGAYPDFLDFNGDGMTDMMVYPNKKPGEYNSSDEAVLYLAYSSYGNTAFAKKFIFTLNENFVRFAYADLNGDGKLDLIYINKLDRFDYDFHYLLSDGEGYSTGLSASFSNEDPRILVGDFNGDGKMEVLTRDGKLYNEERTVIASGGIDDWGDDYVYCYPNSTYIVDFDGDGKSDILAMNGNSSWVYTLRGNTFVKLPTFTGSTLKNWAFNYFGDFNGDGKTDVLCKEAYNPANVALYLSTGTSFVKKQITGHDISSKVYVGDCNKDGKSEIVHCGITTDGKLRIKVGTFNGTNFDTEYYTSRYMDPAVIKDNPENIAQSNIAVGDFDGDGRAELILGGYTDTNVIFEFNDKMNLLVKEIIDGYNKRVQFQYAPLTQSGIYTDTGGTEEFSVMNPKFPLYVVSYKRINAGSSYQASSYYYENVCVHCQGKGLLCFKNIEEIDRQKQTKIIYSYSYNTDAYLPLLWKKEVKTTDGSLLYEQASYFSILSKGSKRYESLLMKRTETDKLKGTTISERFEGYYVGIPRGVTTTTNNYSEKRKTTVFNVETATQRLLGLPLEVTILKRKVGKEPWPELTLYNYDALYNLQSKETCISSRDNRISQDSYTYDSFGNILTASVRPYGSDNQLKTSYKYSANGLNLIEKTDPMGFKTSYFYDERGLLTQRKDFRGNATTFSYDDMGELVQTSYPEGVIEKRNVSWETSVPEALYSVRINSSKEPESVAYYNLMGQEVKTGIRQYNGRMLYVDNTYDTNCLLQKKSLPYTGSSASLWDTYTYDQFDRLTKIKYASGREDTYSYSGTSITENKNGIQTVRTTDSRGKLIKVTDASGTVCYSYLSNGSPDSISVNDAIYTTFDYDEYGRQIKLIDPNTGTKTMTYDHCGNVASETNGNGNVVEYRYDNYNRKIKQEYVGELTTDYSYNEDDGLLASEISSNGTSKTYTYDEYGNLLSEYERSGVNGFNLGKNYVYDKGLVSRIYYTYEPQPFATMAIGNEKYEYLNGHLVKIYWNDKEVWEISGINDQGLITDCTTGALSRTYAYDSYGSLLRRTVKNLNTGVMMQAFGYHFSPTSGNLMWRKDEKRNLQENFEYDMLNRLTSFGGATAKYSMEGNIEYLSTVGSMKYDREKPYAIESLTLSPSSLQNTDKQEVIYNKMNLPSKISQGGNNATFTYYGNGERAKMRITRPDPWTKIVGGLYYDHYYFGNKCEVIYDEYTQSCKRILYVGGDAYNASAVYVQNGASEWKLYYICRDYLGSITLVTDASGNSIQELSYDAWGNLRSPVNHIVYASGKAPELFLGRGYTGHEHLPLFGLINMNARLYDPLIGRFLSPDPYVQLPDNLQSFNRYTYGMNNPLCYVDQNGEFWWFVAAAAIGGFANLVCNWDNIDNLGQGLAYFGVGAFAGVAGLAAGGAAAAALGPIAGFAGGSVVGMASGAVSGFVLGGGNALVGGASFGEAFEKGMVGFFSGGLTGGITGGLTSGFTSYMQGKNFWNGDNIALGRNAFSLKNTPLEELERHNPNAFLPDEIPDIAALDSPMSSTESLINQRMTPYQKGELGVQAAIEDFKSEGGIIYSKEVSVELNGVRNRFDFVGEKNNMLYLYEIKNGAAAGFTKNQKINLPQFLMNKPTFIPVGGNAMQVPNFQNIVPLRQPYTGNYIVVIKHVF